MPEPATLDLMVFGLLGALKRLEIAMRVCDPGLEYLKTDSLMDLLRKEPRLRPFAK